MRVTVLDHGAGNLHSLIKALDGPGREVRVEAHPSLAIRTDLLVVPGVGAFAAAAARLGASRHSLRDALRDGLPCLGVCLGMQLLFERSAEGAGAGIGLFEGPVTRLEARRVPHIGWNDVEGEDELLRRSRLRYGYFANSYACRPADPGCVTAWTTHESDRFPAMVRTVRCIGVQFHPEKSSGPGLALVRAALDELAPVTA